MSFSEPTSNSNLTQIHETFLPFIQRYEETCARETGARKYISLEERAKRRQIKMSRTHQRGTESRRRNRKKRLLLQKINKITREIGAIQEAIHEFLSERTQREKALEYYEGPNLTTSHLQMKSLSNFLH